MLGLLKYDKEKDSFGCLELKTIHYTLAIQESNNNHSM